MAMPVEWMDILFVKVVSIGDIWDCRYCVCLFRISICYRTNWQLIYSNVVYLDLWNLVFRHVFEMVYVNGHCLVVFYINNSEFEVWKFQGFRSSLSTFVLPTQLLLLLNSQNIQCKSHNVNPKSQNTHHFTAKSPKHLINVEFWDLQLPPTSFSQFSQEMTLFST